MLLLQSLSSAFVVVEEKTATQVLKIITMLLLIANYADSHLS